MLIEFQVKQSNVLILSEKCKAKQLYIWTKLLVKTSSCPDLIEKNYFESRYITNMVLLNGSNFAARNPTFFLEQRTQIN